MFHAPIWRFQLELNWNYFNTQQDLLKRRKAYRKEQLLNGTTIEKFNSL